MATTYTNNQFWAIACVLVTLLGAMRGLGVALMYNITLPVFYVLDILMLITFLLMIKRVRSSFMAAIILWILMIITYIVYVSMGAFIPWWSFIAPLYNLSYLVEWIVYIAGIYFSYKSYKELK